MPPYRPHGLVVALLLALYATFHYNHSLQPTPNKLRPPQKSPCPFSKTKGELLKEEDAFYSSNFLSLLNSGKN